MPIITSYSELGQLVHVRSAGHNQASQASPYFVATCDLISGETTEWRVNEVRNRSHTNNGLQSDLILATRALDIHEGQANLPRQALDIEAELAWRDHNQNQESDDARQARVILTNQGCWFKPFDGKPQSLAPIEELERQCEYYLPRALAALAIVSEQQSAASDVA